MRPKYFFIMIVPVMLLFLSISNLFPGLNLIGTKPSKIIYNFGDDYKSAWQKVDSLEQQGLTRSALEVVEEIYRTAKKDSNQEPYGPHSSTLDNNFQIS